VLSVGETRLRETRQGKKESGAMKNFASQSFYRTFDLLFGTINPHASVFYGTYKGVEWVRDRYSISGRTHGIIVEIYTLARPGRGGWSVMVTKENWWAGPENEMIKTSRWARPTSGRRADIMEWFRRQEMELERRPEFKIATQLGVKNLGASLNSID
jgi:hypothetical protein